jgi:2-dehydropantoate 2-reductase
MRVAIVGAGAIGGLLGANFAEAGHDVTLIARGMHLEALRARGLTVRWLGRAARTYRLRATAVPEELGPQDAVVIALKAYSIGPMLPRLARLLHDDTAVVTAINGLPWWYFYRHGGPHEGMHIECLDPAGAMARAIDAKHLLGCVVHTAGEVVEPGVIGHTSGTLYFLGELDGRMTPRLEAIGEALTVGGAEPKLTANIRNEIWMKLIGNLSYNPVAALTLARMGAINANERLLEMIRIQMREAMQVAQAYGQQVTMSIEERIAIARKVGDAKISMHQDLERGRPMEIDAIIGAVLELGRRAGIAMPMVDAVHALIAERARQAPLAQGA